MTQIERMDAIDHAVWVVAQRLGTFSYASLAAEAHIGIEKATRLSRGWMARGGVEDAGIGDRGRKLLRVTADQMPVSPADKILPGTPQGNLWRSMQRLRSFSPTDIAAVSDTPSVAVGLDDATAYCQMLLRAGYLRVERKAVHGKREAIYRLIKNTGPHAPVVRRIRAVVDPNLEDRIVHIAGAML